MRTLIGRLNACGLSSQAYRVSEALRSHYMLGELTGAVSAELQRPEADGDAARAGEATEVAELVAFCEGLWR